MNKELINKIQTLFTKNDIVIYLGAEIPDVLKYKSEYTFDTLDIDFISVVLGMSLATTNRIYVICTDNYFLRYIASVLQASVSKKTNLYFLVLVTNKYDVGTPNITSSIRSFKGLLFNCGFLVHDYTEYLKNKVSINHLKKLLGSTIGPMVGLIKVN